MVEGARTGGMSFGLCRSFGLCGRAVNAKHKKGDRIRLYPVALSRRLDQGDLLAARARNLRAVGQHECPALRAARWRVRAAHQF